MVWSLPNTDSKWGPELDHISSLLLGLCWNPFWVLDPKVGPAVNFAAVRRCFAQICDALAWTWVLTHAFSLCASQFVSCTSFFPVSLQQRHGHVPENGSLIFFVRARAFRRVYHFQTLNNRSLMRLGPLVIVIVVCPSFLGCPLCPCALFALLPWSFSPFLGSSFPSLPSCCCCCCCCRFAVIWQNQLLKKRWIPQVRGSVAKSNPRPMAVLKSGVAKVLNAEEENHGTTPKEILRPWFGA